jgi:hypothetical protein
MYTAKDDKATVRALAVRHLVKQACTEVLRRLGRNHWRWIKILPNAIRSSIFIFANRMRNVTLEELGRAIKTAAPSLTKVS